MQSVISRIGVALALAVFAAATWVVWFGWDDVPYDVWQVLGCGLFMVVGSVVALRRTGKGIVVLPAAATIGFAVPWALYASSTDESGLWVVGLVLLLVGSFLGLMLVLAADSLVRRRR